MRSFKATAGFLVRVSQTRVGSGYVINAGLFQALRESHLFAVDPDLGVGTSIPPPHFLPSPKLNQKKQA